MTTLQLQDQISLVTNARSGIGSAVVLALAATGSQVSARNVCNKNKKYIDVMVTTIIATEKKQ